MPIVSVGELNQMVAVALLRKLGGEATVTVSELVLADPQLWGLDVARKPNGDLVLGVASRPSVESSDCRD